MKEADFDIWPELPEAQVRLAVLRFVEGLSVLETCQTLKITQKEVRKRQGELYRRIKKRARKSSFNPAFDVDRSIEVAKSIVEHIEGVIFKEELNAERPTTQTSAQAGQ